MKELKEMAIVVSREKLNRFENESVDGLDNGVGDEMET